MAEQSYELMHKDDVVASLQLDDLSGAILKVTPGTNPELLPLGGSQGADSLRKWWLRRAVPISQGNIAALLQQEGIPSTQSLLVRNLGLSLSDHYWICLLYTSTYTRLYSREKLFVMQHGKVIDQPKKGKSTHER